MEAAKARGCDADDDDSDESDDSAEPETSHAEVAVEGVTVKGVNAERKQEVVFIGTHWQHSTLLSHSCKHSFDC